MCRARTVATRERALLFDVEATKLHRWHISSNGQRALPYVAVLPWPPAQPGRALASACWPAYATNALPGCHACRCYFLFRIPSFPGRSAHPTPTLFASSLRHGSINHRPASLQNALTTLRRLSGWGDETDEKIQCDDDTTQSVRAVFAGKIGQFPSRYFFLGKPELHISH